MVLLLRKRWLVPCFIIVLLAATSVSLLRVPDTLGVSAPQVIPARATPVLVLDAGHGGADGGAVSASGVYESDINLDIALRLRDAFALLGRDVVMTRSNNASLADDPAASLRQQKVSDTQNRVDLINSVDGACLISIHQNSLPGNTSVHGAQVFYSDTDGSSELAETMQQALNKAINIDNGKNKKPISRDVYLMNHVTCPAVLVECGFLSHSAETEQLQDPDYQVLLAVTICCSATES
ncbi:MAG: N-acetylmuramoyl-L-alanine amidase [Oscillospiraceae bacterium]|nr:N-acetylmuramoyl-L-alanine amidase [Oscillospiraceae bacterium]